MAFLDHIARCNNARLAEFEPWFIGPTRAGFVHRDFAKEIAARSDLFERRDGGWRLEAAFDTPARRTAAVEWWLADLRQRGMFEGLWRGERFPVTWVFGRAPLMEMDEALF